MPRADRGVHPDKLKRVFGAAAQVAYEMREGLESVYFYPRWDEPTVKVHVTNAYFDRLIASGRVVGPKTDSVDREDGRLASAHASFIVEVGETQVEVASIYSRLPAWWPSTVRAIEARR